MNYTVKAAARATGLTESRLRTWERRYGIPSPERSATGRRLYDEADLAVIRRMAALVDAGVSAVDAADAARSGTDAAPVTVVASVDNPLVLAIVRAAETFDEALLVESLNAGVERLGWAGALDELVFPALKRVGLSWETGIIPPAKEHFASELVRRALASAIHTLPLAPSPAPRVVVAAPESERHDLGITALSLLLRLAGLRVVYLGADVPAPDLLEALSSVEPDAVCLSATSASGLASLVRTSRTLVARRGVRLFVGGPAVSASGAEAAGVRLPNSIEAAAKTIVDALGG